MANITRRNNFFGNDWRAVPTLFPTTLNEAGRDQLANIAITCTDNIKSSLDMAKLMKSVSQNNYTDHSTPLDWMGFGDSQHCGQVVMGTIPKTIKQPASKLYKTVPALKTITQYVKYSAVKETDSGPSCSLPKTLPKTIAEALAEALEKQNLFVNSTLAQLGCNILWKMFREGMIEHHGLYLNLATVKVNLTQLSLRSR